MDLVNRILKFEFKGDIFDDLTSRIIYATDASLYRELPLAVVRPKDVDDVKKLICFAHTDKTSLIFRTAGTSLAGQVVGGGIVVDVSKYMTKILELNVKEKWVRVQPGVILDELNKFLSEYGLFFGPETSTANRCMIGGMVGNNSCGTHSLIYGSTREHVLSVKVVLSDGSEAEFHETDMDEFHAKCRHNNLEGRIYQHINKILSLKENQAEIIKEYPDKSVKRRNTGYAIDLLLDSEPFRQGGKAFNFSKLICGSEGTLAFVSEIKLNLVPLPPRENALVCIHFKNLDEALNANLIALEYKPVAVELMDNIILDCTRNNIEQQKNRFFLKGEPAAILIVEFAMDSREEIQNTAMKMEAEMKKWNLGYHFPLLYGADINKIWNLRKAGLGLLSNFPGEKKPITFIEDTAVHVQVLPAYIEELKSMLSNYGVSCSLYAHIGSGEIHLKPVLNLKEKKDTLLLKAIAKETALLVKKYRGSLSGEHGDGRLRGEFVELMLGSHNYKLLKDIKSTWDPEQIFNPGKILDAPPMNTYLRYKQEQKRPETDNFLSYCNMFGILAAAEECSGSGDGRKTEITDGVICPSYMAAKDEKNTPRARANLIR